MIAYLDKLILPPGVLLIIGTLGLLFWRHRSGRGLIGFMLLCLYILSAPLPS